MMKEKKEKSKVQALLSAVKVQINALPIASYISSDRCLVSLPRSRGALRDDTKNGCEGDYCLVSLIR